MTPTTWTGRDGESTEHEVERYELRERAPYHFELERRAFLQVFAALGGGLAVIAVAPGAAQESGRRGGDTAAAVI